MDREMKEADLVVCRAGATTLSELAAAARPAVLVPLPTATDDHQRKNAETLAREAGGGGRRARVDGRTDGADVLSWPWSGIAARRAGRMGDAIARSLAWLAVPVRPVPGIVY